MATQQLMFDILASSKGVDKTFDSVVDSANSMATKLGAQGDKAAKSLFAPLMGAIGGGSIVAALGKGMGTALDMDSAVRTMTAGLALSGPAAETAGQVAGKLYANAYGGSMEDVTAAVAATMSSIKGLSNAPADEVQAMTAKVMDLSKAFGIDVGRSAQVAGQMITTGLAKDGAEAADLLAATLSKVPVGVRQDVMDAVDEYSPFFQSLGMSGGEAMTMLADASAKGMYGIDKTGDALKEFTIRATDMSKASGDAYKALGMDQTTMSRDLLAGGDTARAAFDKIITGLGGMKDPVAQSQAALALFGTPLEDLGTAEIPKFIDSLLNSQEALGTVEGSAKKLGDTVNTGPSASLETFRRQAETSLGDLAAKMLPALTPLLKNLTEWAPAIGPAVIALGAFAVAIWAVSAGIGAFGVIKGIVDVFKAWTAAQWGLNIAMSANVLSLIVIGVVALIAAVVALVMNWDTVVAFLTQAWGGFVSWFQGIMDGFLGWWGGVWDGFLGIVNSIWSAIGSFLATVWAGISAVVMAGVHAVVDPIVNGVMSVWTFISTVFTNIGNFIAGVWNWIASLVGNIIKAFVQTHGDQIAAIWNNIVAVFTAIGGFFIGVWNWYVGIITGALQTIWGFVSAIFTAVWGFIAGVFGAIGGFIAAVWNGIVGIIAGAVSAVWNAIVFGFTAAWNFIAGIFGAVGSFLGGIWGGIVDGVSGMIGNVLGVLGGLGGQILGVLSGAGSWLFDIGRNIVEGLMSGIGSIAGSIGDFFLRLIPGWIVGPFKEALGIHSPSTVFAGFGENIGEGVLVGVGRTQNRIDERMSELVTVPNAPGAGTFGTGTGNGWRGTGGGQDRLGELIDLMRAQRPVVVNGAPGQDEELLGRATAEQMMWRG